MRIRTVKPEFWMSESLSKLSREARLLFIGLFSACDDEGRTRGASRFLASLLFPYEEDVTRLIEPWLNELENAHCIRRYEADGSTYIDIPKWLEHQKIDRPTASKIPPFNNSREESRNLVQGSGIRDQGLEQGSGSEGSASAPPPPEIIEDEIDGLITEDQAATQSENQGIPADFARFIHQDWHSRGGKDGSSVKCPFARYAKKRWTREGAEWTAGNHTGQRKGRNHGNNSTGSIRSSVALSHDPDGKIADQYKGR